MTIDLTLSPVNRRVYKSVQTYEWRRTLTSTTCSGDCWPPLGSNVGADSAYLRRLLYIWVMSETRSHWRLLLCFPVGLPSMHAPSSATPCRREALVATCLRRSNSWSLTWASHGNVSTEHTVVYSVELEILYWYAWYKCVRLQMHVFFF